MNELTVFVRIILWMVVGRLVAGDWIPEGLVWELTSPAIVENVTAAALALGTSIWYFYSKAHKSLKQYFTD
jgi:hypothetical protein